MFLFNMIVNQFNEGQVMQYIVTYAASMYS
jgi:hypothetical protein